MSRIKGALLGVTAWIGGATALTLLGSPLTDAVTMQHPGAAIAAMVGAFYRNPAKHPRIVAHQTLKEYQTFAKPLPQLTSDDVRTILETRSDPALRLFTLAELWDRAVHQTTTAVVSESRGNLQILLDVTSEDVVGLDEARKLVDGALADSSQTVSRLDEARLRHDGITRSWVEFMTTPDVVLHLPALLHAGDPVTAAFADSYAAVQALRGSDLELADAARQDAYVSGVRECAALWHSARNNAEDQRATWLSEPDQALLGKARRRATAAADSTLPVEDRVSASDQAIALLEQLGDVPFPVATLEAVEALPSRP